jgi:hypothetical protein
LRRRVTQKPRALTIFAQSRSSARARNLPGHRDHPANRSRSIAKWVTAPLNFGKL